MWWQDQVAIWQVAEFWRDIPFLAIAMMLDAASGATLRLSVWLKMEERHDEMLLWFLVLLAVQFLNVGDFLPNSGMGALGFTTIFIKEELMSRRYALLIADLWAIQGIAVLCSLACAFIAREKKRPVLVWLAMGYLGTLGSVVWLLTAHKRGDSVAAVTR